MRKPNRDYWQGVADTLGIILFTWLLVQAIGFVT